MLFLGLLKRGMLKPDQHTLCGLGATWEGDVVSSSHSLSTVCSVFYFLISFLSYCNTFLTPPAIPSLLAHSVSRPKVIGCDRNWV